MFDLDIFEIETGQNGAALTPVIEVGEQFGDDFFLKVRQTLAGRTQLALEYEIGEWLRLQSTVTDERNEPQSLFRRSEQNALRLIFFFSY